MFRIKYHFVGEAYGKEIYVENLYWVLKKVFEYLIKSYKRLQLDKQTLCMDLLSAIKQCWYKTDLALLEIQEELISCIDKEVPLDQLRFSVYGETKFFNELNEKFANGAYIIKG